MIRSFTPTAKELEEVKRRFLVKGSEEFLVIPENFVRTASSFVDGSRTDFYAGW